MDFSKVENQFHYFDGKKFQRCLVLNSLKGIKVNDKVIDEVLYKSNDIYEVLVCEYKIRDNNIFKVGNVGSTFNILTSKGWELIITEDMELKNKEIDCKDYVSVSIKEVLKVVVSDRMDLSNVSVKDLDCKESVVAEARMVPKALISDSYNLKVINNLGLDGKDGIVVNTMIPINVTAIDYYNMSINKMDNLNCRESVNIVIVKG